MSGHSPKRPKKRSWEVTLSGVCGLITCGVQDYYPMHGIIIQRGMQILSAPANVIF